LDGRAIVAGKFSPRINTIVTWANGTRCTESERSATSGKYGSGTWSRHANAGSNIAKPAWIEPGLYKSTNAWNDANPAAARAECATADWNSGNYESWHDESERDGAENNAVHRRYFVPAE
jgi:hypothetical protein